MTKKINAIFYDPEGEKKFHVNFKHLDITDYQTIIYLNSAFPYQSEKNTIRLFCYVSSVNVILGTITIYYSNGSYLVITNG